ncbi:MAG: hypothetical protein AAGA22_01115 [Pseudomonadota bacterium]
MEKEVEERAKALIGLMGWRWDDTETSARRVAEFCARIILDLEEEIDAAEDT